MTHYILVDADERAGPQQGHARDGPKIHIDRIGVHVFKIANAGPDEGGLLPLVVGLRPVLSLLPLLATIHIIFPSFILLVLSEPWFLRLWPVALIGRAGTGMMNGSRCGRRWRRHYLDTQSLKPEQERGLVREGGHAFLFPVYHTLGHVVDGVDVPDIHDLPVVLASVSSILDTVLSLHPPPLSSTCSIRSRYHGSDQDVLITRQLFSAAILRRRQQPRRLAALGNAQQRSATLGSGTHQIRPQSPLQPRHAPQPRHHKRRLVRIQHPLASQRVDALIHFPQVQFPRNHEQRDFC